MQRHNLLFRDDWTGGSDVVEGKAATVINLSLLVGQVLSTLIITPVVDYLKDGNYFMFVPCVQSSITFFLTCCITLPKEV